MGNNTKFEYVFSKLTNQTINDFVLIKNNNNNNETSTTSTNSLKAIPFTKHFKIEHIPKQHDRLKLAPDEITAPKITNNKINFKLPYCNKKQISIKKNRRFMPLGYTGGEDVFNSKNNGSSRIAKKEEDHDDVNSLSDGHEQQSGKRKRKHATDNNNDRKKHKKEKKEKKKRKKEKRRSHDTAAVKME